MMVHAQHTPKFDTEALMLAERLLGHTETAAMYQAAVESLETNFPGTLWAIVDEGFGGGSSTLYAPHVHLAGAYFTADRFRGMLQKNTTALSHGAAGLDVSLGSPDFDSISDQYDSRMTLAVWTLPGGRRPHGRVLSQCTYLLARASRVARQIEAAMAVCITDSLTGILNRRGIDDLLQREQCRAQRQGTELSVLFIDMDNFKGINDHYGHAVGDQALVAAKEAILSSLRTCDTVGRLGGDEFLVVLPNTDLEGAQWVRHRVERALGQTVIHTGGDRINLGGTVGVACMSEGRSHDLVDSADQHMLSQKSAKNLYRRGDRSHLRLVEVA